MRTVNIVLLLLAGALSGALVMRVAQHPDRIQAPPTEPSAVPVEQAAQQIAPAQSAGTQPAEIVEAPMPTAGTTATPSRKPLTPDRAPSESASESKPELKHVRGRKPAPLRRVPDPVPAAISPRVLHIPPPQRAELQKPSTITAIPPSPPVLPEQPKETPPARMELENVTPVSAPTNSASEPNQATLNTGMLIPVRLLDSVSSDRNHAGDSFVATLYRELVANGFVIAERGALVEGRVTAVDRDARTLSLELTSVHTSDNQDVPIQTERFDKQSEPDRSYTAAKIGGGAAIGAGAGGGIGAGDVIHSRKPASLTSETRLTFRLRAPVTITERTQ